MTTENSITSIVFIMDASGSMTNMGSEALEGLNGFYNKQKESGRFLSTLVFFNCDVVFHHTNINSDDVPTITDRDYNRCGLTALYDAIGDAINVQREKSTDNVIFVILTDGLDNCSNKYTKDDIKAMITEMETEYRWTFIYLGANQDSFAVSNSIGINNSIDYDNTPNGCLSIMRCVSDTVSRCITSESSV